MVRPRTSKRSLIIAIVIGLVSLAFFSFVFIGKRPGVPDASKPISQQAPAEVPIPGMHRTLYDKPADIVPGETVDDYSTFTSYRLGIRFSYLSRILNTLIVHQQSCRIGAVGCNPVEGSYTDLASPQEMGNAVWFDGYTLFVFDKDPSDTFSDAVRKTALGGNSACAIKTYDLSLDGVEKAVIVPGSCTSDFETKNDGGHFFIYPNHATVFFFVRGPAETKPIFNHKGTWIDTMLIRS